jgi:hypothetical protein
MEIHIYKMVNENCSKNIHQSDDIAKPMWHQTQRPNVTCNIYVWSYNSEVMMKIRYISDTGFWSYNSKVSNVGVPLISVLHL